MNSNISLLARACNNDPDLNTASITLIGTDTSAEPDDDDSAPTLALASNCDIDFNTSIITALETNTPV